MLFHDSQLLESIKTQNPFHQGCIQLTRAQFPNDAQVHPLVGPLICGESFTRGPDYDLLAATQLLHLIVISGMHLMILERLTSRLGPVLQRLTLILFWLLSGCSIPTTRAFASRLGLRRSTTLGVMRWKHELGISLICVLWCQNRFEFFSLLLTTAGALAAQASRLKNLNSLATMIWIWVAMVPWIALMTGQVASPFTLFIQILMSEFFDLVVLPATLFHFVASLVTYALPALSWIQALSHTAVAFAYDIFMTDVRYLGGLYQSSQSGGLGFGLAKQAPELRRAICIGLGLVMITASLTSLRANQMQKKRMLESLKTNPPKPSPTWLLPVFVVFCGLGLTQWISSLWSRTSPEVHLNQASSRIRKKCDEASHLTQKEMLEKSNRKLKALSTHKGQRQKIKLLKRDWPCQES